MKTNSISLLAAVVVAIMPLSGAQAQTMSDANKQKLAENYGQADANGDAMLTKSEFDALLELNSQDKIGKAAQIIRFGRQSTAFNRIDADQNGLLTRQELQALAQ